jgi:hypothetical protein
MRWVGTEVREHQTYNGTSYLGIFLVSMEEKMEEDQRIIVLNLALEDTLSRWWASQKKVIKNWEDVKHVIQCLFQDKEQLKSEMRMDFQVAQLIDGQSDPKKHIEQCVRQWQVVEVPSHLWVQVFPHSLGLILKAWYIHEETRR